MKCKIMKSCKTHFREISSLKNVKIASASFRDCSPVQVFDSYMSKSCIAKMTSLKNETQLALPACYTTWWWPSTIFGTELYIGF